MLESVLPIVRYLYLKEVKEMPARSELRKNHPFYYRRALAYSLLTLMIGISLFFIPDNFDRSAAYSVVRELLPNYFWAYLFLISGAGLLLCLHFTPYLYMKIALIVSVALFAMWSTGFLIAFILGIGVSFHAWCLYMFLAFMGHDLATDPLPLEEK